MGHCGGQVGTLFIFLGGCLCIVVSFYQALGKLTLQKDSPNLCAFSCAVFTQTDQGSPGCAEVCRSDGSYLATRCKLCPHSEAVSSLLGSASCMPVDLPQWVWVCLSSLQTFKAGTETNSRGVWPSSLHPKLALLPPLWPFNVACHCCCCCCCRLLAWKIGTLQDDLSPGP